VEAGGQNVCIETNGPFFRAKFHKTTGNIRIINIIPMEAIFLFYVYMIHVICALKGRIAISLKKGAVS
jgi:hypothetical protein